MTDNTAVIASGNLASSRRIIAGVLAQLGFHNADPGAARRIFTNAGLPARSLEEPDFPISLQQELEICAALVKRLPADTSPIRLLFEARPWMGIENLGVIGMAMKHAATAIEALKVCLAYPELTMGHSRMVVRQQGELSLFTFQMDRPVVRDASDAVIDRLVEYCIVLDLSTSLRNIEDIAISGQPPSWVSLPFPQPDDWHQVVDSLAFPVYFSAEQACIAYPQAFDDEPLPNANPLLFKMYATLADKMALMLAEDAGIEERVTRWLWAYTPPPRRHEIADLLAMSERNLTRQLGKTGTSYSKLLAQVQSERARNFLRNHELSVSEVAYRLGYSDPAAFTRAFTQWTGSSPLRWRNASQTT